METEQNRTETDEQGSLDESTEEFVRDVEQDPSTAPSDDPQVEEVRGG